MSKKGYERDKLSLDNQIVKSNKMIEGRYKLSAFEQRLILLLSSKISSQDSYFNEFLFTVQEFCDLLEVENVNFEVNRQLKKQCQSLVRKEICINEGTPTNPIWTWFNWFDHITYIPKEAKIKMQFHRLLEPYLIFLKESYTKYKLGYVLNFKCEYSFRIYELMKQYEKLGERTVLLKDLKEYLMIEEKYKQYYHIKQKILLKTIKEINDKTDILIEMSEIKAGKKVTALLFRIQENYANKTPIDNLLEHNKYKEKPAEELAEILENLLKSKFNANISKELMLDLYCKEAIFATVMEIKSGEFKKENINTPTPYFLGVLSNKHELYKTEKVTKTDILRAENKIIRKRLQE